jgi:hypothetical protein
MVRWPKCLSEERSILITRIYVDHKKLFKIRSIIYCRTPSRDIALIENGTAMTT